MEAKKTFEDIKESYVVNPEGVVFEIVGCKDPKYVFLRRGNRYVKKKGLEIHQLIVDGKWKHANEHQYRQFLVDDQLIIKIVSDLIVKRSILTQLLIELDDELKPHFEGDNQGLNHIQKSQDYLDRKNKKTYHTLHGQNEQLLFNIMNAIDGLTSTLSKKSVDDLLKINDLILRAEKDPSLYAEKIPLKIVE